MDRKSFLIKEFLQVKNKFPKLKIGELNINSPIIIFGEIDICDSSGEYWETFEIKIILDQGYPYSVPLVYETSNLIKREDKRHIEIDGKCCLDIPYILVKLAKKGIVLHEFIEQKVYAFFANQIFYSEKSYFLNGEYEHEEWGIYQFYTELLGSSDIDLFIQFLEALKKGVGRNDQCPCGSTGKMKYCHAEASKFLKSLGARVLNSDLEQFKKLRNEVFKNKIDYNT